MTTITISISDERLRELTELSKKLNVAPEELVRISVEELLTRPEESFRKATEYVLTKNADLYRRLAA